MDYWQSHMGELAQIKKELKEHNIDPDKPLKTLEETLEALKQMEDLGIIPKSGYNLVNPYESQLLFSSTSNQILS